MNKNDIIAKLRELGVEVDEKASVAVLKQQLAEVMGENVNTDNNQADDKQDGEEKEQGNNANANVETKDEEVVEENSDGIFLVEGKYTSKHLNGKVFVNINEALRENAKAIREGK